MDTLALTSLPASAAFRVPGNNEGVIAERLPKMIGKSIYVADNPAFVGGSPQAVHEQLWAQGRRRRLQVRGALAAVALALVTWAASPVWGILAAAVTAGADALWHWRGRLATSVWRKGQ